MTQQRRARGGATAGRQNRAAILEAARAVFSEQGIDAPLSAVAQRAGVGQGSLYRHFPDRIALAVEVFDENLTALEALAVRPTSTLRDLLTLTTDQALAATSLVEVIAAHGEDARIAHLSERARTAIAPKVEQAHTAGMIKPEVTIEDVMLAISMVSLSISHAPADLRVDTARRGLALVAPALWSDSAATLPTTTPHLSSD